MRVNTARLKKNKLSNMIKQIHFLRVVLVFIYFFPSSGLFFAYFENLSTALLF